MNLKCSQCRAAITRSDDDCPSCQGRTLINEAPECVDEYEYIDDYGEEAIPYKKANPHKTSPNDQVKNNPSIESYPASTIQDEAKPEKAHCLKCHYRLPFGESPCPICGIDTVYANLNSMSTQSDTKPSQFSTVNEATAVKQAEAPTVRDYSKRKYYITPYFAKPGELGELFGYSDLYKGNPIDADYALIDLETSGLKAKDSHIIEIAVIRINRRGEILSQFNTLIKPPNGEVGKTDLHLISKADVLDAPTFADVAGNILEALDNAIVVAHNAKFEEGFLAAEFKRIKLLGIPHIPALDTMWLSQMQFDMPRHKLSNVLEHYGYPYENAHTALGDVVSMARFLPQLLDELPEQLYPIEFTRLPKVALSNKLKPRR